MDLVDVMERVLQKLPDASIHGYADGRAHLSIPLDAHKLRNTTACAPN